MATSRDEQASLLLVDDDVVFCQVLSRALKKRGYAVIVAHSVEKAIPLAQSNPPENAVVDLKLNRASGLTLVQVLHEFAPATRIVMLTGYASIATAVEAIKLGEYNNILATLKKPPVYWRLFKFITSLQF